MQPILVKSYRVTKKLLHEIAERKGCDCELADSIWFERQDELSRPKHNQIFRFKSFASCFYVYYKDPEYILERYKYWGYLRIITEGLVQNGVITEKERDKILDEIDSILPEPYGENLEILKRALAKDGKTLSNAWKM